MREEQKSKVVNGGAVRWWDGKEEGRNGTGESRMK